jgi:tetratricopeptide (TPR) repeat protein
MKSPPQLLVLAMGLAVAGLVFLSSPSFGQTCDPNMLANDQVRDLRVDQKLVKAENLINEILQRTPDDFRANYGLGLIYVDRGETDPAMMQKGIAQLLKTLKLLPPRLTEACAVTINAYSVYNSLGATYFNHDDIPQAEKYFRLAYQNLGKLNGDTRAKVLANLGTLFFSKRNFACSAKYYRLAQAAGSRLVADRLTLVGSILTGAHSADRCVEPPGWPRPG